MNKVVVLGNGYVGSELGKRGYKVLGKDEFLFTTEEGYDLFDKLEDYDVIINCIGKSNTRWCQQNENHKEASTVNSLLPYLLSTHCIKRNIRLIHLSSGCVYRTGQEKNNENAQVDGKCFYTATKISGDLFCNLNSDLVTILRPRLLFSDKVTTKNFLYRLNNFFDAIDDKFDSFTSMQTLIKAIEFFIKHPEPGIFNVCENGTASVHMLACLLGLELDPIGMDELVRLEGVRLTNVVMDNNKIKKFVQPAYSNLAEAVEENYGRMISA